jgi:hypothetical protein
MRRALCSHALVSSTSARHRQRLGGDPDPDPDPAPRNPQIGGGDPGWRQGRESTGGEPAGGERQRLSASSGALWVGASGEEYATFPNGKYDDQVDQMSQALNRLRAMVIADGWRDGVEWDPRRARRRRRWATEPQQIFSARTWT